MKIIQKNKWILILAIALIMGYLWFSQSIKINVNRDEMVIIEPTNDYYEAISVFEDADTDLDIVKKFTSSCDGEVLKQDCEITFNVKSEKDANYSLFFMYRPDNVIFNETSLALTVNNKVPYSQANDLLVMREFAYVEETFATDRMNNEFVGAQKIIDKDMYGSLMFRQAIGTQELIVPLSKGANAITLKVNSGQIQIKEAAFKAVNTVSNYESYQSLHEGEIIDQDAIVIEAQRVFSKNASEINVSSNNLPTFTPFDPNKRLINSVNSLSYLNNNNTVTYAIDIEQAGYYPITLRYMMPKKEKSTVFMDVLIDGKVPFAEFNMYPLGYSSQTNNYTFAYPVYLEAGSHEVSFRLNAYAYQTIDSELTNIRTQLNDIKITLIKITGNNFDRNRNWDIANFLPDLEADLIGLADKITHLQTALLSYNGGVQTQETLQLSLALTSLNKLIENPNEIITHFALLENLIGNVVKAQTLLTDQPISIDRIFVGSYDNLPKETASFYERLKISTTRLMNSFRNDQVAANPDEVVINVWVKRSQQYVDQMQKYVDTTFTANTGIKVNLSVTTDQSKITLAVASNTAPDGVMGIDSWYISDLALRGAVQDIRELEGANDAIKNAVPGALLQMISEDKLFGLPEVQDTYVLFYRTDILESLELDVPQTWNDVRDMMPTLQRYGMNFYSPLSGPESNKSWPGMAPFIMQNGAQIFSDDGMSVELDSQASVEAMTQMSELFTIYSMPLQVGEFYNAFREGSIPIGVSNLSTYVKLMTAAPEIANSWQIALLPGVANEEGDISRWTTGGSSALAIIESSKLKDETWAFFKWWLSDDVQTQFMLDMQMTYGNEYLWTSGNVNAFANMKIDSDHLDIMLEQLTWVQEVPRIPGGYFAEREYSNAWNRIVFNGTNVRLSIDSAVNTMNRELIRKMTEFGYINNGEVIRPYKVPKLEDIERWLSTNE